MLVSEILNKSSEILKKKKISTHLLDSELLLSSILNTKREKLLIEDDKELTIKKINQFNSLINRRSNKEPIAYILKKKEFWNSKFIVNSNTLIPRPETELLVEKAINHFKNEKIKILDIGTGSGCILISILEEIKKASGIGIDISKKALKIAKKNVKKSSAAKRIRLLNKSLNFDLKYKFDLIVSNPPYICTSDLKKLPDDVIKYEPKIALDGGKDGLDVIKKVIYKAKNILNKKGILALEIGYGQYKKVSQILNKNSFKEKYLIKDYQNNIRCIFSQL